MPATSDSMPTTAPPSVGQALRELFANKGVTQIRAAQMMGISRGHLGAIVNEDEDLSADIMLKLHHHFGVAPGYWTTVREVHQQYLATPAGRVFQRKRTENRSIDALELSMTRLLADFQIEQVVRDGYLGIDPFEAAQLTCTAYVLRLGEQGLVTHANEQGSDKTPVVLRPAYELPPGAFVTISTVESLRLPGRLRGLIVSPDDRFAGPRLPLHMKRIVEPQHEGPVTVTVENRSARAVSLRFGEPVAHLEFEFLSSDPVRLVADG